MELTADDWKRVGIFFPYLAERTIEAIGKNTKFVHYCSGEAALSMLRNNEVWMRKTTAMNDPSEGSYGLELLHQAYVDTPAGHQLRQLIDELFPDLRVTFEQTFDGWQSEFRENTFITSLTEQNPGHEELSGRLSMWRGYPGVSPVAIVVNSGPFLRPSQALDAYTSPVAYFNADEFNQQFARLVSGMAANADYLRSIGKDIVYANLFGAFRYAAICTKHPGHREDQEWRVVHSPRFEPSKVLIADVATIRGRPQPIIKIPLRDIPEEGLYGIEIPELVERLIIGPGPNQRDTREAFISVLEAQGVVDPGAKIVLSDIPLREPV